MEAVDRSGGEVFAKTVGKDGNEGYYSLLIVHRDSPLKSLADVLKQHASLALGFGDPNSTSGTAVPGLFAFAQNKIDPVRDFKRTIRASHETNLLAVVNRQVDVATNNTENTSRFEKTHPEEAKAVREIWRSPLIPSDPLVWRKDLDAATKKQIRDFLLGYGRDAREKAILANIEYSGFRASSDAQLVPIRQIELARERVRVESDTTLGAEEKSKKAEGHRRPPRRPGPQPGDLNDGARQGDRHDDTDRCQMKSPGRECLPGLFSNQAAISSPFEAPAAFRSPGRFTTRRVAGRPHWKSSPAPHDPSRLTAHSRRDHLPSRRRLTAPSRAKRKAVSTFLPRAAAPPSLETYSVSRLPASSRYMNWATGPWPPGNSRPLPANSPAPADAEASSASHAPGEPGHQLLFMSGVHFHGPAQLGAVDRMGHRRAPCEAIAVGRRIPLSQHWRDLRWREPGMEAPARGAAQERDGNTGRQTLQVPGRVRHCGSLQGRRHRLVQHRVEQGAQFAFLRSVVSTRCASSWRPASQSSRSCWRSSVNWPSTSACSSLSVKGGFGFI